MNVLERTIFARFAVPGLHRWAHASGARHYLAHPHRHLFAFEVSVPVMHDDRDIEFHDLQAVARSTFIGEPAEAGNVLFGEESCEQLALRVAQHVSDHFGVRYVSVAVAEDGENGARLVCEKPEGS